MGDMSPATRGKDIAYTQVDRTTLLQHILLDCKVAPIRGKHRGLQIQPRRKILTRKLDSPIVRQIHERGELAAGLEGFGALIVQQCGSLNLALVQIETDIQFPPLKHLPVDDKLQSIIKPSVKILPSAGPVAVILRIIRHPP